VETNSSSVVGAFDGALARAVLGSAALVGPHVAVVTILIPANLVEPPPIGIKNNLAVDGRAAAARRALLPRHLGMLLGSLLADLLGRRNGQEGREDGCSAHFSCYQAEWEV